LHPTDVFSTVRLFAEFSFMNSNSPAGSFPAIPAPRDHHTARWSFERVNQINPNRTQRRSDIEKQSSTISDD
jgi:hypothetical protein